MPILTVPITFVVRSGRHLSVTVQTELTTTETDRRTVQKPCVLLMLRVLPEAVVRLDLAMRTAMIYWIMMVINWVIVMIPIVHFIHLVMSPFVMMVSIKMVILILTARIQIVPSFVWKRTVQTLQMMIMMVIWTVQIPTVQVPLNAEKLIVPIILTTMVMAIRIVQTQSVMLTVRVRFIPLMVPMRWM